MRILPVAGNDRLLPESAFNDPMLARHEVHHRARRRPLHFSRRRCCGSRTPIWVVLGVLGRTIPLAKSCFDEAGQISAGRNPISGIDVQPPGKNDNVRCPLAVQ